MNDQGPAQAPRDRILHSYVRQRLSERHPIMLFLPRNHKAHVAVHPRTSNWFCYATLIVRALPAKRDTHGNNRNKNAYCIEQVVLLGPMPKDLEHRY